MSSDPNPKAPRPGPLMRRGPRPLLLHLTLAMLKSRGLPSGSSSSNAGWPASGLLAMGMPLLQMQMAALAGGGLPSPGVTKPGGAKPRKRGKPGGDVAGKLPE